MKHAYQVKMYGTDVTLDLILIMCKLVKFRTTIHTSLIDPPLCICLMYSVALFRMWARDTCDDIIPNHVISHDMSRNLWYTQSTKTHCKQHKHWNKSGLKFNHVMSYDITGIMWPHVTYLLSLERRDAVSETVEGVLYVVSSPPLKKIVMGSLVSVELYTLEKETQTVYTEVST